MFSDQEITGALLDWPDKAMEPERDQYGDEMHDAWHRNEERRKYNQALTNAKAQVTLEAYLHANPEAGMF